MLRSSYSERIIMNYYERGEMNSVKNVINSLNKASLGIIVKVDINNKPVGILTDGDLKRILIKKNKINLNEDISKYFISDFTFFKQDDLVVDAKKTFLLNKINSAPVVDKHGNISGMINYRIISNHGI